MGNMDNNQKIADVKQKVQSLAEKLINDNKYDEALPILEKYNAKLPGDPDICSMIAVAYIMQGRFDRAEQAISQGLAKDTVQFDLLYNLAYIHELKEEPEKAADLYMKADSAADSIEKRYNVKVALDRIKEANDKIEFRDKSKIVFFVKDGMNNFFEDIIEGLSNEYWVRKISVYDYKQIDVGMEWADVCWFEWCDELMVYGSRLQIAYNKKIICRLHRYEAFSDYTRKVNWNSVDKVIFVANHIKETVLRKVDIPEYKCEVVYNGINSDKFVFTERKKGFNLAWIGYVNLRKNPMLVLQYFNELVKKDGRYMLHIAGPFQDEALEQYFHDMITRLKLENNVVLYGFMPNKEINGWLKDKNYLVTGSIAEGHPVGVMEAMSCGLKPVIHYYPGVEDQHPAKYVYYDLDDFIRIITEDDYDSFEYSGFIRENYPFENQLCLIKAIIENLLSYKKLIAYTSKIVSGKIKPEELSLDDLTVLIPCHNRLQLLKDDLDRGLKLGRQPKVIVDDKSTVDNYLLDIIEGNKALYNARIIHRENNDGPGQARWTGLNSIETSLTAFVDDDDMILCLDNEKALLDIDQLSDDAVLIIPRYVLNYDDDSISVGYDRECYNGLTSSEVLKMISSSGEIMALIAGGAIGQTSELKKHSDTNEFKVAEDIVMLTRILSANPGKTVRITESLVHIRRKSDSSLSRQKTHRNLAFSLISQSIGCYYCLQNGIAEKAEVIEWMKARAMLLQKLYNFGESFEIELLAYLKGEIREEVFMHFLELHDIKIDSTLDELAPELKKMRGLLFSGSRKHIDYHNYDNLPLVSIIIPTYNRKDMLRRAIDQALKQDYPNIEVIITDNCSSDGTHELIKKEYENISNLKYNRNDTNLGPVLNVRNALFNLAKGEYCIITSDDDFLIDSTYITKAVAFLEQNKNLAFAYAGYYYNNLISKKVYRISHNKNEIINGKDLFMNILTEKYPYMPNINTVIFRKEKAIDANILNGNPKQMGWDLFVVLRLLLEGDAVFINDIVLSYTLHSGSASRDTNMIIEDGKIESIDKSVQTALVDINELENIADIARSKGRGTSDNYGKWLEYRIFKYMHWRITSTVKSKNEQDALLELVRSKYPKLFYTLVKVIEV